MTAHAANRRDDGPGPRPSWWVDAMTRDSDDTAADERADRRDEAAARRDDSAAEHDAVAIDREQHAADVTIRAHERIDTQERRHVDPLANAVRFAEDGDVLSRIREGLQSEPELADAFARVIEHVDELYVELLRSGYVADDFRSDLRSLTQLLASAAADRRAAEQDREHARADRSSAKRDRDNARSSRQLSAIDRAPRSGDHG